MKLLLTTLWFLKEKQIDTILLWVCSVIDWTKKHPDVVRALMTHSAGPPVTHSARPLVTHSAGPLMTHSAGPLVTHSAGHPGPLFLSYHALTFICDLYIQQYGMCKNLQLIDDWPENGDVVNHLYMNKCNLGWYHNKSTAVFMKIITAAVFEPPCKEFHHLFN